MTNNAWNFEIRGTHDRDTLTQMQNVARYAKRAAIMADGHRGYYMPIGGVAGYEHVVSPHGVGVDIACGNAAIMTDLTVDDTVTKQYLGEIADEIVAAIGFGMGQPTNPSEDAPHDHPVLEDERWNLVPHPVREALRQRARAQLGTVGGGNHYVDVFTDEEGRIWIGCHFGSRGLGYIISNGMILQAQGGRWDGLNPRADWNDAVLFGLDSRICSDYWDLMELAGDYAYAGRRWVVNKVARIMGAVQLDYVHNHHNFAWREVHDGRELVVVRKGATPAFPGQRGFVGGSMGDISVILRGTDAGAELLHSTVHGAGRVMGRRQAAGKWKKGRLVKPGAVTPKMMAEATGGLIRRGGDLDEAPQVYRPLHEVLYAQGPTIVVEEVLHPLIVCMAPSRTGAVR